MKNVVWTLTSMILKQRTADISWGTTNNRLLQTNRGKNHGGDINVDRIQYLQFFDISTEGLGCIAWIGEFFDISTESSNSFFFSFVFFWKHVKKGRSMSLLIHSASTRAEIQQAKARWSHIVIAWAMPSSLVFNMNN